MQTSNFDWDSFRRACLRAKALKKHAARIESRRRGRSAAAAKWRRWVNAEVARKRAAGCKHVTNWVAEVQIERLRNLGRA